QPPFIIDFQRQFGQGWWQWLGWFLNLRRNQRKRPGHHLCQRFARARCNITEYRRAGIGPVSNFAPAAAPYPRQFSFQQHPQMPGFITVRPAEDDALNILSRQRSIVWQPPRGGEFTHIIDGIPDSGFKQHLWIDSAIRDQTPVTIAHFDGDIVSSRNLFHYTACHSTCSFSIKTKKVLTRSTSL